MRIPQGVPDPGRVPGKTTRPAGAPLPEPPHRAVRAHSGLADVATPRLAAGSTASLLVAAMKHMATIEAKQAQMDATRTRQAAESQSAWTNVACAIAGAGVDSSARIIGGAKAAGSALADLTAGQRKALVDTIGAVRQGNTEAAGQAFEGVASGAPPKDIGGLIQHVLRESYLETSQDLRSYADRVKHFNDLKGSLRDQLGGLGSKHLPDAKAIAALEQKLRSAGDDAQLASVDLQSQLQRQQQTLQAMSNVSKQLHDTAMSVIRKMG